MPYASELESDGTMEITTTAPDVFAELTGLILDSDDDGRRDDVRKLQSLHTRIAALVEAAECARVAMSAVAVPNPAERAILQEGADILSTALRGVGR